MDDGREGFEAFVRMHAERVASQYELDALRVGRLFRALADLDWLIASRAFHDPKRIAMTTFEEAVHCLGGDGALKLFADADLTTLMRKVETLDFLVHPEAPILRLDVLASLCGDLARHLEAQERELVRSGHPSAPFESCGFLDARFSALYPVRRLTLMPAGPHADCITCRAIARREVTQPGELHFILCDAIQGISAEDAERIESIRAELLQVKTSVLRILHGWTARRQGSALNACKDTLARIDADSVDLCLDADEKYFGSQSWIGGEYAGGVRDLLLLIGLFEVEAAIGRRTDTRDAIDSYISRCGNQAIWHPSLFYYNVVNTPLQAEIDLILEDFDSRRDDEVDAWRDYGERVEQLIDHEFEHVLSFETRIKRPHRADYEPMARTHLDFLKAHQEATGEMPRFQISVHGVLTDPGGDDVERASPERIDEFRHDGELWRLCFEGKSWSTAERLKGFLVIEYLIRRCPDGVRILDVAAAVEGGPPRRGGQHHERMSGESLEAQEGLSLGMSSEQLPSIREARLRAIHEELTELEEDLRDAAGFSDSGRAEQLVEQREALLAEAERAAGQVQRDGRKAKRRMRTKVERAAWERIRSCVRTARSRIREHLPALSDHLSSECLHIGFTCWYRPNPQRQWTLSHPPS